MNLREARLRDNPPPPLTSSQIARRLWELGVSEDDVYLHIIVHEHKVPIEAWTCLWRKHLSDTTLDVNAILSVKKEA
jgi:hypothetical protein